jgi:hypothetical protein
VTAVISFRLGHEKSSVSFQRAVGISSEGIRMLYYLPILLEKTLKQLILEAVFRSKVDEEASFPIA